MAVMEGVGPDGKSRVILTDDSGNVNFRLPINPALGSAHFNRNDLSSAQTLAPPTGAVRVLIQAIGQNVRYTLDSTTPTSSVGFQLRASDPPLEIPIGTRTVLKVIEETATATLQGQWCN